MYCAVLLILFRLISLKDAIKCLPMDVAILISCSIAIGTSILQSGLAYGNN
jgi:hypothetical protein